MRIPLLLVVALIGGCKATPVTLTSIVGGVTVGSIAVIGRTPLDAVWSAVTGRNCSVVRLDQGKTYCRPQEPPPEPPPYCTRTLGTVNCWANPKGQPPQVADGPQTLTPLQEENRTARWPPL
ncbi:MAG: hypothetical protein JO227_05780 [Acetobacteraceae bacterium]|nr:hypothetical protein [Acetobacteraceae bacterium]